MKFVVILLMLLHPVMPYAQDQPIPSRDTIPGSPLYQKIALPADTNGLYAGLNHSSGVENVREAQAYSRDLFLKLSRRYLHPFGFRNRGFGRPEVYINGILINPPGQTTSGYPSWGGLHHHLSTPVSTKGLVSECGLPPGPGGQTVWEIDPGRHEKQTRLQYGFSNGLPGNQLSLAHHSGLLKKGWAWSIAANKRWLARGYVPGTFYDGFALYFGIRKKLGKKVLLNWNTFAAPGQRGLHQAATMEALRLSSDPYYNPAWGRQEGDIRTAAIAGSFLPESRLNMDWATGDYSLVRLAAALQFGHRQISGLDWYNTADPRPDYYKHLPSYLIQNNEPGLAAQLEQQWATEPDIRQINWQQLYEVNRMHYATTNGVTGRRSLYVLGADRRDIAQYALALQFRHWRHRHLSWNAGMQFSYRSSRRYRKMLDLLGGDYFVNLNQFAERQYPDQPDLHQNNLLRPNAVIRTGDLYAYHYEARNANALGWTYLSYEKNNFRALFSSRAGYTSYQRYGFYKHGIFPNDSYGPSEILQFLSYRLNASLQYRLKRHHQLGLYAGILTAPPEMTHSFVSPEIRNTLISKPTLQQTLLAAFSYVFQHRLLTLELNGYTAQTQRGSRILRFYHETFRTGISYVMQGIGCQHLGVELATKLDLNRKLKITAAGSWKQAFYTTRPRISIYRDNVSGALVEDSEVYLKNYYLGTGPQTVGTAGIQYHPFSRSTIHVQGNYADRHFIEMNPNRLTENAVEQIERDSPAWQAILRQQRLPRGFTLDAYLRQDFQLQITPKQHPLLLRLLIGVRNALNNKTIVQSAYQQLRFDFTDRNPKTFPEKYRFLPGRIWYIHLGIEF